jgi:hypothetical protein
VAPIPGALPWAGRTDAPLGNAVKDYFSGRTGVVGATEI